MRGCAVQTKLDSLQGFMRHLTCLCFDFTKDGYATIVDGVGGDGEGGGDGATCWSPPELQILLMRK